MLLSILILIIGLVLLIKGADFFVEGSSGIAKKLRVPSIIIGLTVVAMGTSLPEAAVSVSAILISQVLIAAILDAFGFLGMKKVPFGWNKYVGLLIMIGGLILFQW